ncbi:MAG: XTP/dITP diphosphatase [Candidatus Phytoplasma sp.]|nr:XTP/dITP diphosphatase [Phytoplasma sp.]
MKIIIATHNQNKVKEFKNILKDFKVELISLSDINDEEEIIEDGKTFKENAIIKAKHIAKKYQMPVISDDSGLEVEVLNNRPGVYSARYSGEGDLANNLKILSELKGIKNRKARFICVIAYSTALGEIKTYEGVWEGQISEELKGNNGFGYDPIFIPKNKTKTVAELSDEEKTKNSHRSKALNQFKEDFKPV